MFLGWVLQVWMSAVCQCLGVGWLFAVCVQCGPSVLGLTRCSLGESCAGGVDEGEWGECTRWGEWDVEFVFDILPVSAVYLNKGTTVVRSWNVTGFMGFSLGSWKESTLSLLLEFFFFRLWRVLKWWSVITQWLQMSSVSPVLFIVWAFDGVRASSFQNF